MRRVIAKRFLPSRIGAHRCFLYGASSSSSAPTEHQNWVTYKLAENKSTLLFLGVFSGSVIATQIYLERAEGPPTGEAAKAEAVTDPWVIGAAVLGGAGVGAVLGAVFAYSVGAAVGTVVGAVIGPSLVASAGAASKAEEAFVSKAESAKAERVEIAKAEAAKLAPVTEEANKAEPIEEEGWPFPKPGKGRSSHQVGR